MTVPFPERPEAQALEKAISELKRDGWTVVSHPTADDAPESLAAVSPDFIATKGGEMLVGEASSRHSASKSRLTQIARVVQTLPNATFEVYWVGETVPDTVESPQMLIRQLSDRTGRVAEVDSDAALIMAFAALEASLREYGKEEDLPDLGKSASQQITALYSLGLLTDRQYRKIRQLFNLRSQIVHGIPLGNEAETRFRYTYSSVEGWRTIVSLAQQISEGAWTPIDRMLDWFRRNYEDPSQNVPHDSGEGGFQYVLGGPYHAEEILREQYPSASDDDIEEAVDVLDGESFEWVPQGLY